MEFLRIVLQIIVGLGILNVWILRSNKSTAYRGGEAKNLREEFATYGLSFPVMCVIGALKITLAVLLLVAIRVPALAEPAALGMAVLMLGAVAMHIKVRDSFKKTLPSIAVLTMCLLIAFL